MTKKTDPILTHGGDWAGFAAEYGAQAPLLDFSANVSPLGLPAGVAAANFSQWAWSSKPKEDMGSSIPLITITAGRMLGGKTPATTRTVYTAMKNR